MAATDGATGRSAGDNGDTAAAERCPLVPAHAASAPRPWPERQPHVLWQCVFDSGHVTQGDAFNCMQVCRQWHECVHGARKLWHSIEISRKRGDWFADLSDEMGNAVAAKRPKEITFLDRGLTRRQLSALLERSAQLRRLALRVCGADCVRALDSLQAPLHSLAVTSWSAALDDGLLAQVVHSAPMLRQLRELYLCAALGDATVQLIAAYFTQLGVLRMFALHQTPAALGHLCADSAHTRTTLRVLDMPNCDATTSGNDITQHILAMPNLEHLRVSADAQWAAEMVRLYKQRYNRDLVVNVSDGLVRLSTFLNFLKPE